MSTVYLLKNTNLLSEAKLRKISEKLPPRRKEKADRYKNSNGFINCVAAYFLFLKGYNELYGYNDSPDFTLDDNDKPYLIEHPEIYFNISHCKDAIACVFSDSEIGIDVQEIRAYRENLALRVCSEKEIEQINSSTDKAREFNKLWTVKEAISKINGVGISQDLTKISVSHATCFTEYVTDNICMSVASHNAHDTINIVCVDKI